MTVLLLLCGKWRKKVMTAWGKNYSFKQKKKPYMSYNKSP